MDKVRYFEKILRKLGGVGQECIDTFNVAIIKLFNKWPCLEKKILLVGSESSGTSAISNLLFYNIPSTRFLNEGKQQWVWNAYQDIYQKKKQIYDYPKLQLFDTIKVPGFAVIIDEFRRGFPNSKVIYIVRDPRDFINSAIKTWKAKKIEDLSTVSWCKENWLDIKSDDPIERLSMRWKKYINSAMALDDIVFVRYEDFCDDKVGTIKKLSLLLELPFNENRVKAISDKQLCHHSVRNYKPTGPGGWRTGILKSEHIHKIEKICKSEMVQWGYGLEML